MGPIHALPSYWYSILILSSHLRLCLPSGFFHPGFPHQSLACISLPPIRATFSALLIVFDLITTVTVFWDVTPWYLVEMYRRFGPEYTALHPSWWPHIWQHSLCVCVCVCACVRVRVCVCVCNKQQFASKTNSSLSSDHGCFPEATALHFQSPINLKFSAQVPDLLLAITMPKIKPNTSFTANTPTYRILPHRSPAFSESTWPPRPASVMKYLPVSTTEIIQSIFKSTRLASCFGCLNYWLAKWHLRLSWQ